MTGIQRLTRFMLLACAPFLGIILFLFAFQPEMKAADFTTSQKVDFTMELQTDEVGKKLIQASRDGVLIKSTIEKMYKQYSQTNTTVSSLLKLVKDQAGRPPLIFEKRVSRVLGKPIRQASSDNIDVKLYTYWDAEFKGYALKVDLKNSKAMNMVLGKDKLGGSETTLAAVKRYGAIAGINAGGFADGHGKRYPTGNTISNSKFIFGFFEPNPKIAGSFVGLNKAGKLIGGRFQDEAQLTKLKPTFGASFEPVLMQNGKKLDIPSKWLNSPKRASRTVIGNFGNDQLIILVTNGANESGSSGATLPEMQNRLQQLGIHDAYNLDGGGSTTLVFNGQVINNPSDGRMRSLPTHFLFFK
ncbi:phosphodiester glycosidase family protein [Paenibacillus psychroresistens]|uniref:Phosphodiester glycosidase family protein n=1 Tax=Paenibacillus psychroresistens TaxID=1778678 RepID=A0A6B8RGN5_9BACL|nr:phosphodiester glycosidase family protein [Paenibacillus psychroresistens]QGQ95269.1 phosphodiester glycosidase family protein [Paenibacillus psychroresistens]